MSGEGLMKAKQGTVSMATPHDGETRFQLLQASDLTQNLAGRLIRNWVISWKRHRQRI